MSKIRLRRHTDGRAAIRTQSGYTFGWFVIPPCELLTDADVFGPGWLELFVAELPEPDYVVNGIKVWDLGFGELTVGGRTEFENSLPYAVDGVDQLRADALKMLAAVSACEKYRTEREAAT